MIHRAAWNPQARAEIKYSVASKLAGIHIVKSLSLTSTMQKGHVRMQSTLWASLKASQSRRFSTDSENMRAHWLRKN